MWWGDDWRLAGSILDNMLISLNLTSPGRVRAISFLKTRYPTITALNKAWYVPLAPLLHRNRPFARPWVGLTRARGCRNTTYTSFDTIKTLPGRSAVHTTDSNDFAYIALSKFFNVTVSGMRTLTRHRFCCWMEKGGGARGATSDPPCLTLCGISHS